MSAATTTVLVTGGAGFIGSNLVRHLLASDVTVRVVNYDLLTYAGNPENLADVAARFGPPGDDCRYAFVHGDILDTEGVAATLAGRRAGSAPWPVDLVVHLAAESHVDRSILGPKAFVDTNVTGTLSMLEASRRWIDGGAPAGFRFVHVSTDEVYGTLRPGDPAFTEQTPLAPNSPYAASKAASDLLVRAYVETYGFPAVTTRCSNNYGPFQFPEKLIPLMITRALRGASLPVYGDGQQVRDWLHVEDHAAALGLVARRGTPGRVYNIGGEAELTNLEIVREVLRLLDRPASLIEHVADRPGHDRRYAMDISRIRRELGWSPTYTFERGLAATVAWYLAHQEWWERVLSEAYRTATRMYLSPGA